MVNKLRFHLIEIMMLLVKISCWDNLNSMFDWLNNLPIWVQVVIGLLIGKTIWAFVGTAFYWSSLYIKACMKDDELMVGTMKWVAAPIAAMFIFSFIGAAIWVVFWLFNQGRP